MSIMPISCISEKINYTAWYISYHQICPIHLNCNKWRRRHYVHIAVWWLCKQISWLASTLSWKCQGSIPQFYGYPNLSNKLTLNEPQLVRISCHTWKGHFVVGKTFPIVNGIATSQILVPVVQFVDGKLALAAGWTQTHAPRCCCFRGYVVLNRIGGTSVISVGVKNQSLVVPDHNQMKPSFKCDDGKYVPPRRCASNFHLDVETNWDAIVPIKCVNCNAAAFDVIAFTSAWHNVILGIVLHWLV